MLIEEAVKTDDLLDGLDDIPLGRMYQAAFRALMRLQLWITGHTHELMLEFSKDAREVILKAAGPVSLPDGTVQDAGLDASSAFSAQIAINTLWGDTWKEWMDIFQKTREEAAQIAFGVQAEYHDRIVLPAVEELEESTKAHEEARRFEEGVSDDIYDPQLLILMEAAGSHIYGDGLNLSGRIWRIDRESRSGMNTVLLSGVQSGDSAWNIAKNLEQFLGPGQGCPRWAKSRLYGMTASERTTSAKGLFSGESCSGQGVSYKALRLARSEVQKIHNLANDRMMAQEPWVTEEQIHLSVAHPEFDICDEVVDGGKGGEGVYPVGKVGLPLHPNCLCYKTAVLVSEEQFTSDLSGWLDGSKPSATFDAYEQTLGGDISVSLRPASVNLAVWLLSNDLDEWMK